MSNLGGRRGRRRLGAGIALGAVTLALLGAAWGAGAATVEEPATVSRQAYFTYPATEVTPPLIKEGFPPGTACLVAGLVGAPELCGEQVQSVGGALGLSDGLPIPLSPDGEIAQPIVPGTTPVGMLGGQPRYASLMQLSLPTLPEGQGFASFELIFTQSGLNFAVESPAMRAAVLALMSQVSKQDPARLADDLAKTLQSGELTTDTATGIEACPATEPWTGGDAQGAAADGTRVPESDCILGTTGVLDDAKGTWTFDITFAVQAWTQGASDGSDVPNEGLVLRPVGAPNLAYGDPDLSTNWVVSLADREATTEDERPRIRYTTMPLVSDGGPVVTSPPIEVPIDGGTSFEPVDPGLGAAPTPSPGAVLAGAISARWGEEPISSGEGHLPGWIWLALPLGLAGAALFAGALDAPADAARRRPGALTRLVAQNERRAAAPPRS